MKKAIAAVLLLCLGIAPFGDSESVVVGQPVNVTMPVITVSETRLRDFYETPANPCSVNYSKERYEIQYLGKLDCALAKAGAS